MERFNFMNATEHSLRCKSMIPHLIVMLWLIYIAAMVWEHDVQSVQPPHYDSLTYMQKAMNFWKAVDQGNLFNPLNIEPTNRPPGTILLSYPFKFSSDFKGFHFRSIFFPIVCIVIAVYMAAGIPESPAAGWGLAAVAIFFSAISMLYNFDNNEISPGVSYWGLVDNFQAGIAAMAAAGYVRSLRSRSLPWLMWGAFFGSFTLLIKPSGLMVIALLTSTWLFVVCMEWFCARKCQLSNTTDFKTKILGASSVGDDPKKSSTPSPLPSQNHSLESYKLQRYIIIGGIQTFLIYFAVVLLCFFSNYFSMENFAYAKHALKVMGDLQKESPPQILSLLLELSGIAFAIWVLGKGLLIIYYLFTRNNRHNFFSVKMVGLLLSVPIIWSLGVWYWLVVQVGGSQVRYFAPFFMMGAVFIIPVSLYIIQHGNRWIRLAEFVLCLLPALNIGVLLMMESPSLQWQRFSGVNIAVALDREEVHQAYTFLDELRNRKKNAILYSFFSGVLPDIFITVGLYEEMARPDLPAFKAISTVNWENGFVVKTDQLLSADYILVRKDLGRKAEKLTDKLIDTSDSESIFFQEWICGLNESAGVKIVTDGSVLRLLEVVDRQSFENETEFFVSAHSWRPEFIAANSQQRWWNEADVSGYATNFAVKEIDFMGTYSLHALLLRRADTGIKVECWWEEMCHEDANKQWVMFFHLVDQSGKICHNLSMPLVYAPPFDNRRWKYGAVSFGQPISSDVTSLAFGIYRPNHDVLMPDKGTRDWGGRRVLVPLSNLPADAS